MYKTRLLLATTALVLPARCGALEASLDSIDDLPEDVKKEYVQQGDKFVLQVNGMKSVDDFTRLQNAHNKEKQDHGALKSRIKEHFGEEKFEDLRAKLDKLPELEAAAAGKIDEEAINKIVEGRVKTALAPVERERDNLKAKVGDLEGTVGDYKGKERTRSIHDEARKAATAAKMLPEAVDDFLLLADRIFEVREDDGKVVVKDNVGYTPGIEASVLLTDLQSKRPHWWGSSSGGGAGGNRDGDKGGANPWSHAGWNITEQGKIMSSNPSRAQQLAKAAGHSDPATATKPPAPAK